MESVPKSSVPLCVISTDAPNKDCLVKSEAHSSTPFVIAAATLLSLGYQFRQNPALKPILPALLLAESMHAVLHLSVLMGSSIDTLTQDERIRYFSMDLLTSLLAFFMTESNPGWIGLHAFIHVCAVMHLLNPWSGFFEDVFDMANQHYYDKSLWSVVAYGSGTLADIVTHILNVRALYAKMREPFAVQ